METLYEVILKFWWSFFPAEGMRWYFITTNNWIVYIITSIILLVVFFSPFAMIWSITRINRRRRK